MTATTVRPAVETPSRCGFSVFAKERLPIPDCGSCGGSLNVLWGEGDPDRDPFHVYQPVMKGLRKVIGAGYRCRACIEDGAKEDARIRAVRRLKRGSNFID